MKLYFLFTLILVLGWSNSVWSKTIPEEIKSEKVPEELPVETPKDEPLKEPKTHVQIPKVNEEASVFRIPLIKKKLLLLKFKKLLPISLLFLRNGSPDGSNSVVSLVPAGGNLQQGNVQAVVDQQSGQAFTISNGNLQSLQGNLQAVVDQQTGQAFAVAGGGLQSLQGNLQTVVDQQSGQAFAISDGNLQSLSGNLQTVVDQQSGQAYAIAGGGLQSLQGNLQTVVDQQSGQAYAIAGGGLQSVQGNLQGNVQTVVSEQQGVQAFTIPSELLQNQVIQVGDSSAMSDNSNYEEIEIQNDDQSEDSDQLGRRHVSGITLNGLGGLTNLGSINGAAGQRPLLVYAVPQQAELGRSAPRGHKKRGKFRKTH